MTTRNLKTFFDDRGYAGPVPLFTQGESRELLARLQADSTPPQDWEKGQAVTSSAYYELATDDRILDVVTSLIGEDLMLWGASLLVRRPGFEHPWHTDAESSSPAGETVSVWIGLFGTSAESSLKLVPFSHRFGVTLQETVQQNGGGPALDDAEVARLARERDGRSGVVQVETVEGQALLFDGRLWHGSHNVSEGTRRAVLLQYATPSTPIRIPNLDRPRWPFEFHEVPRPPCIVVSGRDSVARNRVVRAPAARTASVRPSLTSRVHPLQLPLDQDPEVGWKPHSLLRGSTADIRALTCHVSILDPGREPHPPHRHEEEELLLVLEGEPTLVLGDEASEHPVGRGMFAYYPADFAHTLRNTSDAPATYLMFKWTTDRKEDGDFLAHRLVAVGEPGEEQGWQEAGGVAMEPRLNGETKYLRHLHAHVTTLEPGGGYEPHADSYDVGLIVLEGTVETLGEQVGPNGVVFYAAGEPHGIRNAGDGHAVYLVFEFRGRHSTPVPREVPLWRRMLWAARHPRAAAQELARRLRA